MRLLIEDTGQGGRYDIDALKTFSLIIYENVKNQGILWEKDENTMSKTHRVKSVTTILLKNQ